MQTHANYALRHIDVKKKLKAKKVNVQHNGLWRMVSRCASVHKSGVMKKQVQLRINVRSMRGQDYCLQGSLRSLAPLIPVLCFPETSVGL